MASSFEVATNQSTGYQQVTKCGKVPDHLVLDVEQNFTCVSGGDKAPLRVSASFVPGLTT